MTQRERILGGAVGALVGAFVLYFGFTMVMDVFTSRAERIENLTDQKYELERSVRFGSEARERLASYESRSLPGDLETAKTQYKDWLFDVAIKRGLQQVQISPTTDPPIEGLGRMVTYNFEGMGRLPEVVSFLHELYRVELLHRVHSLRIQPMGGNVGDSRYLKITLGLEALWLDTNELTKVPTAAGDRLALSRLDAYQAKISDRNLFGLPNQSPKFDAPSSQRVFLGERMNLELKASDPDLLDNLQFALGDAAPEGAEMAPGDQNRDPDARQVARSARLAWTPRELGTVKIPVTVKDDGLPSMPVTKTIEISVVERPPAVAATPTPDPPQFDVATQTQFTSILEVDGEPEIWLYDRTAGQMHRLRTGDEFTIGSIEATVGSISSRSAVLETESGRLRIIQGQFLSDAEALTSADAEAL